MPVPTHIGYGDVGKDVQATCFRTAWIFDGQKLGINGQVLTVTDEETGKIWEGLNRNRKMLFGKAPSDPRVVRYHTVEVGFKGVNHEMVQWIERRKNFIDNEFPIKLYQHDYPDIGVGGADYWDASYLAPSTPASASCGVWYLPFRGISSDSGDGPTLYVDAVEQTSGITWDYTEGAVSFSTPVSSSSDVRAYFVWKPYVKIVPNSSRIVSRTGKVYRKNRYDVTITFEEL
jgi:hypothetical protein